MRLFEGIGKEFLRTKKGDYLKRSTGSFQSEGRRHLNSQTEPSRQQPIHPHILENVLAEKPKIWSFPINQHAIIPKHHWRSESNYTPLGCLVSRLGESFVFLYACVFSKVKSLISFFQVELLLYWVVWIILLALTCTHFNMADNLTFCLTFDLLH